MDMKMRIRELRKERGLTQRQLGALIDKAPNSISMYERGCYDIPLSVLDRMAKALDCSLEELIAAEESSASPAAL
jgi:transcriptional regulator with XRE-family HTH domain